MRGRPSHRSASPRQSVGSAPVRYPSRRGLPPRRWSPCHSPQVQTQSATARWPHRQSTAAACHWRAGRRHRDHVPVHWKTGAPGPARVPCCPVVAGWWSTQAACHRQSDTGGWPQRRRHPSRWVAAPRPRCRGWDSTTVWPHENCPAQTWTSTGCSRHGVAPRDRRWATGHRHPPRWPPRRIERSPPAACPRCPGADQTRTPWVATCPAETSAARRSSWNRCWSSRR